MSETVALMAERVGLDSTNHCLFSETSNLLDGARRALLELHAKHLQAAPLGQYSSIFAFGTIATVRD